MLSSKQVLPVGLQIAARSNAGNLGRDFEKRMGHLTGRHIDLVMKGNGYNHICFCGAGSIQHIWIGAVTDKASDVKNIANPLNECGLIVDYGDIVIFGRQSLSNPESDLTSATDQNLHCIMASDASTAGDRIANAVR